MPKQTHQLEAVRPSKDPANRPAAGATLLRFVALHQRLQPREAAAHGVIAVHREGRTTGEPRRLVGSGGSDLVGSDSRSANGLDSIPGCSFSQSSGSYRFHVSLFTPPPHSDGPQRTKEPSLRHRCILVISPAAASLA